MIWNKLEESLIFVNLEAMHYKDIMDIMGNALICEGYAKTSYVEALIEREKKFPTGLDIHGIGVALPHTDDCHVNRGGVSIAVLKNPVNFYKMDDDNVQIPVRLVFMLTVQKSNTHLKHLQDILMIIQDTHTLQSLLNAQNCKEIIQIIKEKEKKL